MKNEEISKLVDAYRQNSFSIEYHKGSSNCAEIAILATIIDYLRGDIEGLKPISKDSNPIPSKDNGDPDNLATETMKRLGSLGLQSVSEIRGFRYDCHDHFLLFINGRFADTGWVRGDPHISAFERITKPMGIDIQDMS